MTLTQYHPKALAAFALIVIAAIVAAIMTGGADSSQSPPPVPLRPASAPRAPLGMNLTGVTYYMRGWPFVDVMKIAQPWQVTYNRWKWYKDFSKTLKLRPDGYPAILAPHQAVAALIYRASDRHYPAGTYVLSYKGNGRLKVYFDAKSMRRLGIDRFAVTVVPSVEGIGIKIMETDPADPIHDMHLWMPGFQNANSPFHTLFVDRLKPFKVIRFMSWGLTNGNTIVHWSDRTLPSEIQTGPHGVAYEYMIDLCNQLHADPWICVPTRADDNYILQLAALIKTRLDPSLKAYIEYGNEMWNHGGKRGLWMLAQAKAADETPAAWYVHHSVRIFQIFTQVFHGHSRLVRVIAGQTANTWLTKQLLASLPDDHDGEKAADAFAIAPYFGGRQVNKQIKSHIKTATVDDVLRLTKDALEHVTIPAIRKQAALAAAHGLKLVAYEGGQGLTPGGNASNKLIQLFTDANRDPRMGKMYTELLTAWSRVTDGVFVALGYVGAPSKWGEWGVLEYQNQPVKDAPKYRDLVAYAEK